MPPLPETIMLVLALFAAIYSHQVWLHTLPLLLGAILTPRVRMVSVVLLVMGLAGKCRFTIYHGVLNHIPWSSRAQQSSSGRMRWWNAVPAKWVTMWLLDRVPCPRRA